MDWSSGRLEVLKIDNLSTLQSLRIKQNQNYTIEYKTVKCNRESVNLNIIQDPNSSFKLVCIFKHSMDMNLTLNISGNNTTTKIYNLVDLDSDQKVSLNQNIVTSFANNIVEHLTKIVVDQNSLALVRHFARANPTTKNLDLNQKILSLILSPKAKVQMQPILQIESQDVQCKHSSTQGFLDTNAIFYLQSRGLSLENSKNLLVEVFKGEILRLVD
jgi:Fe-S cluster assembly protein SufD